MFSSSANCVRIPPAALLVEPDPSASRSSSTTSCTPSLRRWKAVAAPRAPPPITTASAVLPDVAVELAERRPLPSRAAAPLDEDELLDREVVLRRGLQLDARVGERITDVVHVLERFHEAGPREVLAGLLERISHRPRGAQTVNDVRVVQVEGGRVLR